MLIAHHQPRLLLCGGFRAPAAMFEARLREPAISPTATSGYAVVYFGQRAPGCLHKLLHGRGHHEDVEAVNLRYYSLVPLELRQKVYVLTGNKTRA